MMNEKDKILDIKDLDISFRTSAGKIHALRGVNIDLYRGETVAIVGESGSGKSVSMKAAMGLSASNAIVNGGQILFRYKTSGIDYNVGQNHLIEGTHSVFATDEELARWTKEK